MFTFIEIIEIIITSIAVSYIFTAFVPRKPISSVIEYVRPKRFDLEQFKMAAMIGVPAIILHELFHKFSSIILGIPAYYTMGNFFGVPAGGLLIGIFLRIVGSSFIFFAPGYVVIQGFATPIQTFIIAFSGPLANIILFSGAIIALNYFRKKIPTKYHALIYLTKRVNIWLFILNMLPIPPLDGSKVFGSLFQIIGGLL